MIDKTRKVIYIIVGTLIIISLVFSLAKKFGLAASSDDIYDYALVEEFPLPLGVNGFGIGDFVITQQTCYDLQSDGLRRHPNWDYQVLLCRELGSDYLQVMLMGLNGSSNYRGSSSNSLLPYTSDFVFTSGLYLIYNVYSDGSFSFVSEATSHNDFILDLAGSIISLSGSHVLPKNTFIVNYPVYAYWGNDDHLISSYPGSGGIDFESFSLFYEGYDPIDPDRPSWISKGQFIRNFEENFGEIENNSELPEVDTALPSDPSNNASWFQKILNGLKTINLSIKSGIVTLGQQIGSFFDSLMDLMDDLASKIQHSIQLVIDNFNEKFSDLRDWIEGVKDKVEEIADYLKDAFSLPSSEEVAELFNQFLVGTTFGQFLGISNQAVQIIGSLFGQSIPEFETLVFTFNIDFFGQTFPLVLDFGFYTSSVRNTVVGVFLTFFYIGFLIHIIHQLPSIISGSSGVEKDISPIVKDQVKHTRWNMGLHN